MRVRIIGSAVLLVLGLSAAVAAGPSEKKGGCTHATTVAKQGVEADAKQPCAHKCIPPCDPAHCDHRCDPAKCGKLTSATEPNRAGDEPCGAKTAKTVAFISEDDGRSEPAAKSTKGGSNKPCGGHGSKTVADKQSTGVPPCQAGKSADAPTVKSKGCGPGCHCQKGAKLTADKPGEPAGKVPCPMTGELIDKKDCPIGKKVEAIRASMPTMKYRVGDQVTGCSKSASALAEKNGKSIEYLVKDEAFADKGEATVKLAALLEEEAARLVEMEFIAGGKSHRCPESAKSTAKGSKGSVVYRYAGFDFDSMEEVSKASDAVDKAISEVKLAYKVDGKVYHCNKTAGSKCKKSGKKMTYVIGEEETGCEQTAKLMLAETKVRTIVETAADVFRSTHAGSPS